jgi:hypothetical protein
MSSPVKEKMQPMMIEVKLVCNHIPAKHKVHAQAGGWMTGLDKIKHYYFTVCSKCGCVLRT